MGLGSTMEMTLTVDATSMFELAAYNVLLKMVDDTITPQIKLCESPYLKWSLYKSMCEHISLFYPDEESDWGFVQTVQNVMDQIIATKAVEYGIN